MGKSEKLIIIVDGGGSNPRPKTQKPMVCRRRHLFVKEISGLLVRLATCKRLTNIRLPKTKPYNNSTTTSLEEYYLLLL